MKESTLKPDAPEFVPTHSKAPLPPPISKTEVKEAVKAQKKLEKEEKKASTLTKRAGKKAAKFSERHGATGKVNPSSFSWVLLTAPDGNLSTADELPSAEVSNDITEVEMPAADKPKRRHNRRHQTKSEPTRTNDSLDGQQDSDVTAVSSGEGQPLLQNVAAVCHFTTNPV